MFDLSTYVKYLKKKKKKMKGLKSLHVKTETYLEPKWASMMKLLWENR